MNKDLHKFKFKLEIMLILNNKYKLLHKKIKILQIKFKLYKMKHLNSKLKHQHVKKDLLIHNNNYKQLKIV